MAINGAITRYVLDGLFIILIGTFGFVANKADTKAEQHETRITATEIANGRIETKLDYLIKGMDELKADAKRSRP